MKLLNCFAAWFLPLFCVSAQQLTVVPSQEAIGYQVLLAPNEDADSTAVTEVRYRISGQNWQPGFPAARLSLSEFQGSIVHLIPGTTYELEVNVVDSTPVLQQKTLNATVSTLAVPQIAASGTIFWVSPNGSGTAYSESQPGNLQALLSGGLSCGTTVMLKGGTYTVGDLILNLTQHCSENSPITLLAAPGEQPVFDGGSYTNYTWYPGTGDTTIWWTSLPASLEYNALCVVDGERMYPYAFLTPNFLDPTYPSLWTLGYGLSGFYRNKFNQVFVKTLDGKNMNNAQVIFSQKFTCLTVYGNQKNLYLRIKGITFRYYGKGRCDKDIFGNPTVCYPSTTLRFVDASQVIVDSCTFTYCNFPVLFEGNSSNNLVMNCHITDGTGYWSHAAFKRSIDAYNIFIDPNQGSAGRYLENVGIHFRPADGQVVTGNRAWRNTVNGVVVGIGFGQINSAIMKESEAWENTISGCFDGMDVIGGQRNARIWGNNISYCPVGISLISEEQKPVYIFRNILHHLDQRQNYQNDPAFLSCNNVATQQSWATALKLNAGGVSKAGDLIYFIHNTVHSTEPYAFNLYLWAPEWKLLQLWNNIFYAEGEANFFFDGIQGQSAYSFESWSDNIVNPVSGLVGKVRQSGGSGPGCSSYTQADSLQYGLTAVTGSSRIFLTDALHELPHFVLADLGNFQLEPLSPLIDAALSVPGFNNDFSGMAPDIGALENQTVPCGTVPALAPAQLIPPNTVD